MGEGNFCESTEKIKRNNIVIKGLSMADPCRDLNETLKNFLKTICH